MTPNNMGFGDAPQEEPVEAQPPVSLDRARRYFLESNNATAENDKECERDLRYYHGDQLSGEVRAKLKQRGQPALIDNQIRPAINGLLGVAEGMETAPECFPRSYENQNSADIATKVIRYNLDCAHWDSIRRILCKDYFIQGTCAVIVGSGAKVGDKHIAITPILWEDLFFDPLSRFHDFRDARYLGIAQWHDADTLKSMYPETYDTLGNPFDVGSDWLSGKHSDEARIWIDAQRKRIRVVELYLCDENGQWQRLVFCNAGFLDFGPSVYKDDCGQSVCPIVAASFEVDRATGDRYGAVRNMVLMQDAVNNRESMLLHAANSRQVVQKQDGIDPKSKDIAKREAAKVDGVIPMGYEPVPVQDIFSGNMALLQQAQASLARQAPTPAVLSRFNEGDSGRSMQVLQQAGMTEWAPYFSHMLTLELQVYHRLWWASKQFLTVPTQVRITNEARTPEFEHINVPKLGPVQAPVIDPQTGQPAIDPTTGQPVMQTQIGVVGVDNDIVEMDVDIILSTVPQTTNLEQETTAEILRYASSVGISPLDPQFKAILMMFPIADKQKTLDRWDTIRKELEQDMAPQQQMQQQMQQAQQQLTALHVQSKAAKDQAAAQKTQLQSAEIAANLHDRAQQASMLAAWRAGLPPVITSAQLSQAEEHQQLHQLSQALGTPPPGAQR